MPPKTANFENDLISLHNYLYHEWYQEEKQRPKPKILYHYTDAQGLIGILDTGCIWATSALHLNDPLESRFAYALIREELTNMARDARSSGDQDKSDFLLSIPEDRTYRDYSEYAAHTDFVASFSEEWDDLGQFRAYSNMGKGYAIGFDRALLEKNLNSHHGQDFRLVKMRYEEQEVKTQLRSLMDRAYQTAKQHIIGGAAREEVFRKVAFQCIYFFEHMSSSCKQSGFASEKEYRIAVNPLGSRRVKLVEKWMEFRARDGALVPYLRIAVFAYDSTEYLPLTEIVAGPSLDYKIAEQGLLSLVFNSGHIDINHPPEIKQSGVQLR